MKNRKSFFFCLMLSLGALFAEPKHAFQCGSEELCIFTQELVERKLLDGNRKELTSGLQALKKEATSADLQQAIEGWIQTLTAGGSMDAFVEDIGRLIKFRSRNGKIDEKDLLALTKALDKKFDPQENYHQAMINARTDEKWSEAVYYYCKLSEGK